MGIIKEKETMKMKLWDIIVDVSWANISKKYFGRSRSWLSKKMLGKNSNGGDADFTEEEKEKLKSALLDLSERIKVCANKI